MRQVSLHKSEPQFTKKKKKTFQTKGTTKCAATHKSLSTLAEKKPNSSLHMAVVFKESLSTDMTNTSALHTKAHGYGYRKRAVFVSRSVIEGYAARLASIGHYVHAWEETLYKSLHATGSGRIRHIPVQHPATPGQRTDAPPHDMVRAHRALRPHASPFEAAP